MTSEGYGACLNDVINGRKMQHLIPTPTAMDSTNATATMKSTQVKEGSMHSVTLTRAMAMGLLPTPTTQEATSKCQVNENGRRLTTNGKDSHSMNIGRMAAMGILPTPTAQIVKHGHSEKYWDNRIGKRQMDIAMWNAETNGKTSQLSPQFVMEMMGFPTDWTLLPFLSGETSQSKQEEMQ
jgi:hypothetical protein